MTGSVEIPETGQAPVGGVLVAAANIRRRPPIDGSSDQEALRVTLIPFDERGFDACEGDEVTLGDGRWRVAEIAEDPVNRRGRVVLAPV